MKITSNNVNDGLLAVLSAIHAFRELDSKVITERDSRNGRTLSFDEPVMIVHENPNRCACFLKSRDANPFFHIFESLWMLAGRKDVKFLSLFNKNMINYSDDGIVFNAPYGYRLRHHFGIDQLQGVVDALKKDPNSRQAVALLWDPADLNKQTLDKACNLELVFKIQDNRLDMTVFNRSNDVIYGALGANAVHMSMIMMYVCSKLGCNLGKYCQISNCLHVYVDGVEGAILNRMMNDLDNDERDKYPDCTVTPAWFDEYVDGDIQELFAMFDRKDIGLTPARLLVIEYESKLFNDLVMPMLEMYIKYKTCGKDSITEHDYSEVKAEDWRLACRRWIQNRTK